MPFVILALDKPGAEALRTELRPAHLDYLTARQDAMLAGGAVLDEEGRAIGGLLIVDTEDRAAAERFIGDDPFQQGGLFASVRVLPWRQSFFDRRRTR
ncbi:YciI family protein [Pseudorhodoferax sp.]|uniref:YciI family protein n=1 Tax=Pseudorhodoferax sp. TaxID=1993553 RepID=UPI002DD6737B|nr:YciI family protein [Pseudorhodoferax sp.]